MHKCHNQKTINENEKLLKGNGKKGVIDNIVILDKRVALLNLKHNFHYLFSSAIIVMLAKLLYDISKLKIIK
jgi:hypothetical protein